MFCDGKLLWHLTRQTSSFSFWVMWRDMCCEMLEIQKEKVEGKTTQLKTIDPDQMLEFCFYWKLLYFWCQAFLKLADRKWHEHGQFFMKCFSLCLHGVNSNINPTNIHQSILKTFYIDFSYIHIHYTLHHISGNPLWLHYYSWRWI